MSAPPPAALLRLAPARALWSLTWPVVALGLIRSGYHLAAAYWAGHLPDAGAAQAALGVASFAVWILMSIAELSSVGTHALVARAEGARERWRVGAVLLQGGWVALLCGGALALLSRPMISWYFDAVGFRGALFAQPRALGEGYLQALLLGAALVHLHALAGATFRGLGDTRTPMVVSSLTLALNAALDPVLMLGWGGFPALGLAGAGWATVAANGVGLGLFAVALRGRGVRAPRRGPERGMMGQIVRIGGPSMLSGIGFCLVYVALGDLLARFGPSALAGLGLGHRLEGPAYQVCAGFGAAAATLVGQHLGAGERAEARAAAHRAARWCCGVMVPLSVLFVAAPRWLVGLFAADEASTERGASYLLVVGVILVPMALEVIYESAFAGSGETWMAMGIVVVWTAARIPLAWWLSGEMGLIGVWVTIAGTCALKGFLLWGAFAWRSKRKGWGAGVRLA
jgi:putative MATE family efflux protein